ncbi:MAG: CgeB family protein [Minisyncoccia bacterium]|jgi:glycosyltransferase involved in cell wall biosynthesis
MIVLIFDKNYPCTTGQYVKKELEKLGYNITVILPQEKNKILEIKPDFVLAIDYGTHYILDIDYHPKAIWLIDTHLSLICDETMVKSFDIIFVAQKEDYEKLKKKFKYVYWLPLAGDPEYHGKKNLNKIYDIGFVGGLGMGNRKKFLLKLKREYQNSFIGPADCKKICEIYSQSKIIINYSIKNDINMRIFEALMSGSMLITNRIKNNGFKELFEENKDLVIFDSWKDLKEKIDYYLKNEEEREKIALSGYQKAINYHKYEDRVKFILEKVEELKKEKFENPNFAKLKIELKIKNIFWIIIKIFRRIKWKIQELA